MRNRRLRIRTWLMACLVALLVGSVTVRAVAQEQANSPDWAFGHPAGEAVTASVSALSLLAMLLPQRPGEWGPSSARERNDSYAMASDFSGSGIGTSWQILAGWALDVGYYQQHDASEPFGRALRSSLVDLESVLLATGLTAGIKRLAGRCRPRAWIERPDGTGECDPRSPEYDAFPSGHVATVGAVAGSRFVLALRSSGAAEHRYAAFAFAETATVATAPLRVLAGAHSWEDVLAGWAIGHAAGALVALVHPMTTAPFAPPETLPAAVPTAYFRWSGHF